MSGASETMVALFDTREQAEEARAAVAAEDLDVGRMEIVTSTEADSLARLEDVDGGAVASDVAKGAGLGAAAGAGVAALAGLTFLATGPVAAALVGAGVGAGLGAAGGTAASANLRRPQIAQMAREALQKGHCALLVDVGSEADALKAQDVLQRTASMKVIDRHGGQRAT